MARKATVFANHGFLARGSRVVLFRRLDKRK